MRINQVRRQLLLIIVLFVFGQESYANEFRFSNEPLAATLSWPQFHRALHSANSDVEQWQFSKDQNTLATYVEVCAYYVLSQIDRKLTSEEQFDVAQRSLLIGLKRLGCEGWNSALLEDHDVMRKKLLASLIGQRYLRFPRVSLDDHRIITLCYPFPEIYHQDTAKVMFRPGDSHYAQYAEVIRESSAKPNEEIVLITRPKLRNPIDFESKDWENLNK